MINTIVLDLLEAQVTLYAVAADGVTLGAALWSGQVAEKLTVREQWITLETRPTGAAYPVKHPLAPQYEISIDRVWALPLSNLVGFSPTNQTYVLEVIWTEEESQQWHRRRFYGVTITSRSFGTQNIESEFVDGQEFAAQYVLVDAGGAGEPPSPVVAMPLVVFWSGSDGYYPLYTYDTLSGFLLADGESTTGHATIAPDGSSITFFGAASPVLATTVAGVTVGELHDTLPTDLPQLQFFLGTTLLGVVTTAGVWARVIADGALPAVTGFEFEYAGVPVLVMNSALCTALAWTALN
jgi:hypothetical protein